MWSETKHFFVLVLPRLLPPLPHAEKDRAETVAERWDVSYRIILRICTVGTIVMHTIVMVIGLFLILELDSCFKQ